VISSVKKGVDMKTNEDREYVIAVLREVMEWINNWSPDFVDDPEWEATEEKVDKLLGKR
jgi:hypothetical protein